MWRITDRTKAGAGFLQDLRRKAVAGWMDGWGWRWGGSAALDCSFILFIIAKPMINVPQSACVLKYSSIGVSLICRGGKAINSNVSGSRVAFAWICRSTCGTLRWIWARAPSIPLRCKVWGEGENVGDDMQIPPTNPLMMLLEINVGYKKSSLIKGRVGGTSFLFPNIYDWKHYPSCFGLGKMWNSFCHIQTETKWMSRSACFPPLSSSSFLVFSHSPLRCAGVCRRRDRSVFVVEKKGRRGRVLFTHVSCGVPFSWGRDDRKSARWHGAGLQHVTPSLERQRGGGGGRGREAKMRRRRWENARSFFQFGIRSGGKIQSLLFRV